MSKPSSLFIKNVSLRHWSFRRSRDLRDTKNEEVLSTSSDIPFLGSVLALYFAVLRSEVPAAR